MKRDDFSVLRGSASPTALRADVEFARAQDGTSYVSKNHVGYPFHIGRTLELQGDPEGMTSLYLQSCSGGLFEHDCVNARFTAREGALAHVSTGASTIVHRMQEGEAKQRVDLRVRSNALLEYLPEPTILFTGSRLRSRLSVQIAESAVCIAGDAFLLHDPHGKGGKFDWFDATTEVIDDENVLLARDHQRMTGSDFQNSRPGVLGRWRVVGTLIFALRGNRIETLLDAVREPLENTPGLYASASRLPNGCGLWARLLAEDAIALRAGWHAAWAAARTVLTGVTPRPRRR